MPIYTKKKDPNKATEYICIKILVLLEFIFGMIFKNTSMFPCPIVHLNSQREPITLGYEPEDLTVHPPPQNCR